MVRRLRTDLLAGAAMSLAAAAVLSLSLLAAPHAASAPQIGSLGDFYGCTASFTLSGSTATLTAKADRYEDCHGSIAFYVPSGDSQYPETLYGSQAANLPGKTVVELPRLCDLEVDFFSQPATAPKVLTGPYSDTSLAWILLSNECAPTTTTVPASTTTVAPTTTTVPATTTTTAPKGVPTSTTTPSTSVPSPSTPAPTQTPPSSTTPIPGSTPTAPKSTGTPGTDTSPDLTGTTASLASTGLLADTGAPEQLPWVIGLGGALGLVGLALLAVNAASSKRWKQREEEK